MSNERLSVAEAARVLDVHPQRVHQRIREGSLHAEKLGSQWVIDADDLRRVKRHAGPGRPLSEKSAWDLIAVASESSVISELSPSARSRARSRLRDLLLRVTSAEPEDAAALLVRALGNRAERAPYRASPQDLPDLRRDARVHLSGVSLEESNVSAADLVEGYVAARDLNDLLDEYLLSPVHRSRANVILHVVPSVDGSGPAPDWQWALRSRLLLAADLAEHDGVREKNEAIRSVADLDPWWKSVGRG